MSTSGLALEHRFYFRLLERGGLGLFLCADLPRFDDFHRFDGAPQQCVGYVCRRCVAFPRKELEE